MTALGLLRIIASPTHSTGVPRQTLGKKWFMGDKWSPPPLHRVVPSRVFWRLWVSLNLGAFLSSLKREAFSWHENFLQFCAFALDTSLSPRVDSPRSPNSSLAVTVSTGLLSLSTSDIGAPSSFTAGSWSCASEGVYWNSWPLPTKSY